MENLLQGLPHVSVYLDDILVTGTSMADHLKNLAEVLRLREAGMCLKMTKCAFMLPKVEYLGHTISQQGLQPTPEKVRAIMDAPTPKDVSQLKSFLGIINYYGKFLPNLSTLLAPLHKLLQKQTTWEWGSAQEEAFQSAKEHITSARVLVHFDPSKEIVLSCDASPFGIGAVLSHIAEDGTELPVAFASRSLSPAEKRYAQLEREGLAIVFGVKHFHQYLWGRHFTILSDHKPLRHIFNPTKAVSPMVSARMQRWALVLGAYHYTVAYKPGKDHGNADMLSRLPLPEAPAEVPLPAEVIQLLQCLQNAPVSAMQIKAWTDHDPIRSQVRDRLLEGGWSAAQENPEFRPYHTS